MHFFRTVATFLWLYHLIYGCNYAQSVCECRCMFFFFNGIAKWLESIPSLSKLPVQFMWSAADRGSGALSLAQFCRAVLSLQMLCVNVMCLTHTYYHPDMICTSLWCYSHSFPPQIWSNFAACASELIKDWFWLCRSMSKDKPQFRKSTKFHRKIISSCT